MPEDPKKHLSEVFLTWANQAILEGGHSPTDVGVAMIASGVNVLLDAAPVAEVRGTLQRVLDRMHELPERPSGAVN